MKKTITIGLLLLAVLNSPAEVLIYKNNKTVTRNGEQATIIEKFGGFLVFDTETRFIVTVSTHTVAGVKKFFVTEEFDYYLEEVTGFNKTYTVFNRVIDEENFTGQDYFKGANARFLVNGKLIVQPKILTTSTRAFLWPEVGSPTLYESTGTATLDPKQTAQYDSAGLNLNEVVSALRGTLLSKAYVEEN